MTLTPKKKPRNYVNNAEFLVAMTAYKKAVREAEDSGDPPPRIPNYIGVCLYDIANRLAYKPNFINYTYRDDMVADGLENAIMCINNFDPAKSSNPFAYFTQVVWFAFIRRIQKEKKQTYIRHKVLENAMLTDTVFEHGENSDFGSSSMKELTNDYINDFVEKYEARMETKKKAVKKRKGLEVFYDEAADTEEIPD
jgi:DNA-directed RNA polymerase specialized sigma24 family protein